ncbi:hypothetical protein F4802DRAFT_599948 [Xylaria palmicola]|nr:hypothetical protein F4802DRAFT_599948 [Xylaria palmicola]
MDISTRDIAIVEKRGFRDIAAPSPSPSRLEDMRGSLVAFSAALLHAGRSSFDDQPIFELVARGPLFDSLERPASQQFAEGPSPVAEVDIPAGFIIELGSLPTVVPWDLRLSSRFHWGILVPVTVVVPVSFLNKSTTALVLTGWNVNPAAPSDPDGEPDPGTHRAKVTTPKDTHKAFVDSTDDPTPQLVSKKLIEQGLVTVC